MVPRADAGALQGGYRRLPAVVIDDSGHDGERVILAALETNLDRETAMRSHIGGDRNPSHDAHGSPAFPSLWGTGSPNLRGQ